MYTRKKIDLKKKIEKIKNQVYTILKEKILN